MPKANIFRDSQIVVDCFFGFCADAGPFRSDWVQRADAVLMAKLYGFWW